MPAARASRMIAAPVAELWELIGDPHHLPRWWPRVTRVEAVEGETFTEVLATPRGGTLRADFKLVEADAHARRLRWAQQLAGTPFERLFSQSETEVTLVGQDGRASTLVTIELRQTPVGLFPRLGAFMFRRAAADTIEQALDGLESIVG